MLFPETFEVGGAVMDCVTDAGIFEERIVMFRDTGWCISVARRFLISVMPVGWTLLNPVPVPIDN